MFKPGKSGNPHGRPKGIPNKAGTEIKKVIQSLWAGYDINGDLRELTPRDRLKAMSELLPYIIPRMQSISADVQLGQFDETQLDLLIDAIANEEFKSEI